MQPRTHKPAGNRDISHGIDKPKDVFNQRNRGHSGGDGALPYLIIGR